MNNIIECINSNEVSYHGQNTDKFEKLISDYVGAYAVLTNSGTSALHLVYAICDMAGSEVLVPSVTYIATVNPMTYCNIAPHFVDSNKHDLNISVDKLETYINTINVRRIGAITVVHVLGNPCDMDGIMRIANKHNLIVIEDAAQGLGSFYDGKHVGTIGDFGTISFNGNKVLTTGSGGALLTKKKSLAHKAKHLSRQCRMQTRQSMHDGIGYNYRMPALNASLGLDQWEQKKKFFENQKNLSARQKIVSNNWKRIDEDGDPIWQPIHLQKPYKNCKSMDLSGAEWIGENIKIK